MIGRPRRGPGLLYAAAAVFALMLAVVMAWQLRAGLPTGDVDPAGAAIALLALAASALAMRQTSRSWRWQETNVADLLPRLADAVRVAEQTARARLLGHHDKAIDVDFDFRPAGALNAAGAAPLGRLSEIAGYYTALRPRRLVITGAPGSGKTLLAVELILALLEHRGPNDPVPLRLSAPTWRTDTTETVADWLVHHLVDTFNLSRVSAQALVDGQQVLPIIDGLDEMDAALAPGYASRAGMALRMLNAYQHNRSKAEMVITCRDEQYRALNTDQVWVHESAQVHLRPVTAVQTRAFLTTRVPDVDRWHPVLDVLEHQPDHALSQALTTPWRLTLATVAYEQRHPVSGAFMRDPADLADPTRATPDGVRDHLLALFVPATVDNHHHRTHPGTATYPPEQVHRWLAVLAAYLEHNATPRQVGGRTLSSTDLVAHELWPLAGARRVRLLALAITILPTLIILADLDGLASQSYSPLGATVIAAVVLLFTAAMHRSWTNVWPTPSRLDLTLTRVRSPHGRRHLVRRLAAGLTVGLVVGLAAWVAIGLVSGEADAVAAGDRGVGRGRARGRTGRLGDRGNPTSGNDRPQRSPQLARRRVGGRGQLRGRVHDRISGHLPVSDRLGGVRVRAPA